MKDLFFKKHAGYTPFEKRDISGETWDKDLHDERKIIWLQGLWLKNLTRVEKKEIKVIEVFNVAMKEKNETLFKRLEDKILSVYLNTNRNIVRDLKKKYGLTSFRNLKIDTATLVKILHDLEK